MMQPWTYEITFAGQADAGVCAEFDDCAVIIGPGTTTLHAHVPDQGALCELVQRITGLGLELVYLQLVAPQPEHWQVHAHALFNRPIGTGGHRPADAGPGTDSPAEG
jgi:hypothetical protein